jgi:two-component system LytT family response regulator
VADLIRTLIVDDEPLVREGLCDVIGFIKDVEIVGECDNGLEAVQAIRRLAPDAVFLDIRMPGLNGFEVIESLKPEERPIIIFVTAYNEFAVGAFKINAADYLLKPFNEDNVRSAITRVRERLLIGQNLQTDRKINQLLRQLATRQKYTERFIVPSGKLMRIVETKDIEWIEAAGNYVSLHTKSEGLLLRETMKSIEKQLNPKSFVRIHRSTIVNLAQIKEIKLMPSGDYMLMLQSGKYLTLSRWYRDEVFKRLK